MCAAGSRIFVQESIYEQFVKLLTVAAQSLKHGDGFDPACQQGPLVSQAQLEVLFFKSPIVVSRVLVLIVSFPSSVYWVTSSLANRKALRS